MLDKLKLEVTQWCDQLTNEASSAKVKLQKINVGFGVFAPFQIWPNANQFQWLISSQPSLSLSFSQEGITIYQSYKERMLN